MDPIYSLVELGVCTKPDSGSNVNDNLCRILDAQKWHLVEPISVSDGLYLKGFVSLLSFKIKREEKCSWIGHCLCCSISSTHNLDHGKCVLCVKLVTCIVFHKG